MTLQRPRTGAKIFRVPRPESWRVALPREPSKRPGVSLLTLVYGFAAMIAAGMVLLVLPISSNSGQWTSPVDALFTATSAVCVTGLVVVDTLGYWNPFGQFVIMLLIQLGGLGFMTSTTVLLLAAGRRVGLRGRILVGESVSVSQIGGVVRLARNILIFSLAGEAIGTALFFVRFQEQYDTLTALWKAGFQSVSAFNNAGFDVFGGFRSLSGYSSDYLVVLTTAVLVILGGISFVVLANVFRSRGLHGTTVDTKLVLLVTGILLALGTAVVLVAEFNNPLTLGQMPLEDKALNAFFQSVTTRSSGFSTFATGAMPIFTIAFTMVLMFIGGAAGSTAGGIKVNTLGVIAATIWGTIRGREYPGAFGREFLMQQVFRAVAVLVVSLGTVAVIFLILSFTESFPSISILFEAVSAFGTVGLSTGITPQLSFAGKLVIIATMFIGRLGPLTLTMSLAMAQRPTIFRYPKEPIRTG